MLCSTAGHQVCFRQVSHRGSSTPQGKGPPPPGLFAPGARAVLAPSAHADLVPWRSAHRVSISPGSALSGARGHGSPLPGCRAPSTSKEPHTSRRRVTASLPFSWPGARSCPGTVLGRTAKWALSRGQGYTAQHSTGMCTSGSLSTSVLSPARLTQTCSPDGLRPRPFPGPQVGVHSPDTHVPATQTGGSCSPVCGPRLSVLEN